MSRLSSPNSRLNETTKTKTKKSRCLFEISSTDFVNWQWREFPYEIVEVKVRGSVIQLYSYTQILHRFPFPSLIVTLVILLVANRYPSLTLGSPFFSGSGEVIRVRRYDYLLYRTWRYCHCHNSLTLNYRLIPKYILHYSQFSQ